MFLKKLTKSYFILLPLLLPLLSLYLVACGTREDLAPVVESRWRSQIPNSQRHIVARGETLYAIAFRYDIDYRILAKINHLPNPYLLRVGQIIILHPPRQPYSYHSSLPPSSRSFTHLKRPAKSYVNTGRKPAPIIPSLSNPQHRFSQLRYVSHSSRWSWPYSGPILNSFAPQEGKKGIDIAGKKGGIVRAADTGIVAYSGNGLSGYGNLIIIKHNGQFLTAYAHNARNFVKEGQTVKAGEKIAEIGLLDRRNWGLHFEIRQAGIPVNPMRYLSRN